MKIGTPLRWVTAGLLTLAATLGTGCNTTHHQVNTVEPANPAYVRRNIEDKRIIRDSSTAKSVHVLNVIDGSTSDGLMRVGVEVQNTRSKSFRFNYRFDWFDAQGFPVNTPTSTMVSQQLEGGQMLVLTSVAPNPSVKDFRLSIQESTREHIPVLRKN
jgi:uncharacterized protein YcfL